MIPRLLTLWDNVRTSLWALPLAMIIGAGVLAFVALNLEFSISGDEVWYLYSGKAEQVPTFLGNLVSAVITMATLAISITMVVLTLAAQQLGPRLIRSFMSDRRTQLALGLFVATVVYLLLILRSASGGNNEPSNIAVTIGTFLVLVSVTGLLLFVHHLARAIISDNIIDRVGTALDADIRRLLPDKEADRPPALAKHGPEGAIVPFSTGGYLQAVDYNAIVRAAAQADALVELQIRAGQHAVAGGILARVTPPPAAKTALAGVLRSALFMGPARTAVQDLEFSIHQLVEIALRALSPGINDPYTAATVLDRLTRSLRLMMTRGAAQSRFTDKDGVVRLTMPVSTFGGLTDAAFNQIRQAAANSPAILIRMADNIGQLLRLADHAQRAALEKHLRLVVATGARNILDDDDRKDLQDSAEAARQSARERTPG